MWIHAWISVSVWIVTLAQSKYTITGILFSTLQRRVNAHFEAVSGLQFCWQAQDFQAFFIGKGAKVLVYAVFRACGNFRVLWPQTFLAMEPEGWSTHWVETDPVELAMERDWQANLAAEEAARQKAEDRTG